MDKPTKETTKEYGRIDQKSALLLVAIAVAFDAASVIPGVNELTGVAAQTILPYMFSRYGVNIFTLRKLAPYIATWIVEMLPGESIIPALTLETIYFIYQTRKEDRMDREKFKAV